MLFLEFCKDSGFILEEDALRRVNGSGKLTHQISTLDKSVGAQRFYAIKLDFL